MPIQYVSGDLFDNAYHAQAFAYGCNGLGSMGARIARTFRRKYEAVLAKLTQHGELRGILLATGSATILEHTTSDHYWSDGGDNSGKNRLGQTFVRLREELRHGRRSG